LIANLTISEQLKVRHADILQCQELVGKTLREEVSYNFLKIHLISYYTEQIVKFGVLGQFFTDIAEAMRKEFKDAYHHSNKVNAPHHIITTITNTP